MDADGGQDPANRISSFHHSFHLAVIEAVLIVAQVNGEVNSSMIILTIIKFIYIAKRVISPIYLVDAFIELLLIACILAAIYAVHPPSLPLMSK